MAPRPNWKGFLKLSLVSCPIALYTAASASEKISLHLINRETGHRLRRQLVDAETAEVVEDKDQARGYEVSRGEHVILDDDELDDLALESTHTIDIETFVPRGEVDALYLDTPYFLIPDDEVGEQAFSVIRDALRRKKMAGLARIVLYRRERIVMLEPRGAGIVATTLRYAYEVRKADDYFDEIPKTEVPKEMLDLADHIIATKAGTFDPTKFEDRYEDALIALIKSKQAGKPMAGPKPAPSNVINLMDALRRSVGGSAGAKAEKRVRRSKSRSRASPRRRSGARSAGRSGGTRKAG